MRLAKDRLTFLALCALHEAFIATRRAPVRPSAGLRLALAWLYAQSEGDKAVFDSFWETVQREDVGAWKPDARYRRAAEARHLMRLIFRLVEMPDAEARIESMRRP